MSNLQQAACQFCSRPDDSVQVLCESRCLVCAKCQSSPGIRRLLVENSKFRDDSITKQFRNEELAKLQNNAGVACSAISGTCPICLAPIAQSMLLIIETYRDALKAQAEDQANGKSSADAKIEEVSALIPNFLKKYKLTYENPADTRPFFPTQNAAPIDMDAEVEKVLNSRPVVNAGVTTTNPATTGKNAKNNTSNVVQLNEGIPVAARVNITVMLEFVLDCYQGQWQGMTKSGNDSMLTTMMKQCNKKKLSQKTNDIRTKCLLEFLLSNYGHEIPELIFFNHLIGLQPKFTTNIFVGWAHITAAALIAICYDTCIKCNELFIDQTMTNSAIIEFRNKLNKCFQTFSGTNNNSVNPAMNLLNQSNTKVISLKKALKIVEFLIKIRQTYWMMIPLMSSITEYESRMAWTEESTSKLINMLFYVSLAETNLSKRGVNLFPIYSDTTLKPTTNVPMSTNASTAENVTTENTPAPSVAPNQTEKPPAIQIPENRRQSSGNLPSRRPSTASGSLMRGNSFSSNPSTPGRGSRRKSSAVSSASNPSLAQQMKEVNAIKASNRNELLKSLQMVADKLWKDCNNKYEIQTNYNPNNQKKTRKAFFKTSVSSSFTASLMEYLSELGVNLIVNKEESYIPLDFQESIDMAEKQNLFIPINDFLFTLIICWEKEYFLLLEHLEKAKLTKMRRTAFTSNYAFIAQQQQAKAQAAAEEAERASRLPTMTAGEKQAITKLLFFYRNPETKEFQGVDWEEVEVKINSAYFPFTIPRTLLQKSRLELSLLVEHMIKTTLERIIREENETLEEENQRRNILLNYQTNKKMKNMLADYRDLDEIGLDDSSIITPPILPLIHDHDEDIDNGVTSIGEETFRKGIAEEKGNYADRLLFVSLEEANREFIIPHRKIKSAGTNRTGFVPLSPAYQSTLSLDIPNHLKIDSSLPNLSKYGEYDTLKEQFTAGGMNRGILSPQKGYNSSNVIPGITTNLETINKTSHNPKNVLTFVEVISQDRRALIDSNIMPAENEPILNSHFAHQFHPSSSRAKSASHAIRPRPGGSQLIPDQQQPPPIREKTADEALQEVSALMNDTSYYDNIEKYRKNRIMSTRNSILSRSSLNNINKRNSGVILETKTSFYIEKPNQQISKPSEIIKETFQNSDYGGLEKPVKDQHHDFDEDEDEENDVNKNNNNPKDHLKKKDDPNISWKSRIIPYLNLVYSLNKDGNLVVNLSDTLIAESSVKFLSMKNGNGTLSALDMMLKTYCKKWQLEYMKILQLSGNPRLLSKGGELLGKALQQNCKLIHINVNSMGIGDLGLRAILEGIVAGHGEKHLIRLDLKENNITIALNTFALLGRCINLKFLDLSKNSFTLDKECQWETFSQAIYPLIHSKLEYLSLAYNKIQDQGFQRIINELILTDDAIYFHIPLRVLDVAHCFITNQSKYTIKLLLVNSVQKESDASAYKRAFEYTQKYLALPEFARPHNHQRDQDDEDDENYHQNQIPFRLHSHLTDQKVAKVYFKPEFIHANPTFRSSNRSHPALAGSSSNKNQGNFSALLKNGGRNSMNAGGAGGGGNRRRANSSGSHSGDAEEDTFSHDGDDSMNDDNNSIPSASYFPMSSNHRRPGGGGDSRRKSSVCRESFISHLSSIVHRNDQLIMSINNIQATLDPVDGTLQTTNNTMNEDSTHHHHPPHDHPGTTSNTTAKTLANTTNTTTTMSNGGGHLQLNSFYILTHLQSVLLQGSVITQNVWDEILDYSQRSTMQLLFHEDEGLAGGIEYGNGIEDITCYQLNDYGIELHAIELAQL